MIVKILGRNVTLSKIEHDGQFRIAISFDYNGELLALIKQLPDRRYSKTHSCWHIPYDRLHYNHIIELVDVNKQDDNNNTINIYQTSQIQSGTIEDAPSKDDHTGISSNCDTMGENSVMSNKSKIATTDIRASNPEPSKNLSKTSIVLNGGNFFIKINYNPNDANFLRSLEKTYWNSRFQNWVVKATSTNLDKLQHRFSYWDQEAYLQCYSLIMEVEDPYTVELFCSPEFPQHFAIRIKGSTADFNFLKAIPERDYQAEFKRWLIPRDQKLLDRIIAHYDDDGAKVINKVRLKQVCFQSNNYSPSEGKEILLSKFDVALNAPLATYIDTMIRLRYSWNTIKSYTGSFAPFLQHFGGENLVTLTTTQVNEYIAKIALKNVSESLLHNEINAIKFYFAKVIFRTDFKLDEIQRPKKSHTLPKLLTIQEVDRLLRALDNLKHLALLYALYSAGIRLQELLNITINDIFWERNQIMIKGGKGKKDRMVMLSQVLKEVLVFYFDSYQPQYYLFEGQDGHSSYSPRSVQQVVKQAARKAGITRVVTPHVLRHCFATHMLDNGTDVRFIQELLGHKDIKTTLIYTHVTNTKIESLKSPIDQLNLGNRFLKNAKV